MTSRAELRALLDSVRRIAILGLSNNPMRASNEVAGFLMRRGYECAGVNPGLAGQTIHGMPVVARLADLPEPVDMVDVFRAAEALPAIVDEVLAMAPRPRILWTQLGVIHEGAAAKARAAGLIVVMDQCPKIVLGG